MKKNTSWFVGCDVMREDDFASAEELVVLINLEDANADLTRQGLSNIERLKISREKAYWQLKILRKNKDIIETLKKSLIKDTAKIRSK